jgi:hypothetical protein
MDQIIFNVRNAKNAAAVFISNDPAANAVTLIVNNASGSDLPLRAGAPVMEPPPDGGPTSLYLSFGDVVPTAAIPQIKVAADGWQVKYFSDPAPAFALTPAQDRTFASQSNLNIRISNFPVAGPPRTASIGIDYYGLGTVDDSSSIGSVVVQNPPRDDKPLQLDHDILGDPVAYITVPESPPIKNTLVFHFSNPSPTDPLVDVETKWKSDPPEFLISFVPAKPPGYGALTTLERMKDIEVGLAQVYQDAWSVTKDVSGAKPFWRLKPKTHEILGIDEAATVEFRVTHLVTELKAGLALFYVQYTNIPGYADGFFAFPLEKRIPNLIAKYAGDKDGRTYAGATVLLEWNLPVDTDTVAVTKGTKDQNTVTVVNGQPPVGNCTDRPQETTDYQVTADGIDHWQTTVRVAPVAAALGRDKSETQLPGTPVVLTSRVEFASSYTVKPDVYAAHSGTVDDVKTFTVYPLQDTTYTLEAAGFGGPAKSTFDIPVRTKTGAFSTQDIRPWNNPRAENSKRIVFSSAYPSAPTIATGLSQIDVAKLRIAAAASGIDGNGFTAALNSWGDSVLYSAASTWLAVAAGDPAFQIGQFNTMEDHPWNQPKMQTSRRITFARPYPGGTPHVVVWLNELDITGPQNVRVNAYVSDVDAAGFTVHIDAWADTVIYSAGVTWIAYPANLPGVVSGSFNTMDVRRWDLPVAETAGTVTFAGGGFAGPPLVALALNMMDIRGGTNLRIVASAGEITASGLRWHLNTWGDTTLYSAGAQYIAMGRPR